MKDFLIPAVTALITGGFTYVISRIGSKYKKFNASREALQTFVNVDSKFKDNFMYSNFEENNFHLQTGVRANYKNISKFKKFHDEIGLSWEIISSAQNRLSIEEDRISVRLKKYHIHIKDIILGFTLSIITLGFISFTFFNDSLSVDKMKSLIFSGVILLSSLVFGFLLVSLIDSINSAHIIQKRLASLEKNQLLDKGK